MKGSGRHDALVARPGERFSFSLGPMRGNLLRPIDRGSTLDNISSLDNKTYQISRFPPSFDAVTMPCSFNMLQHVRAGFSPEEQGELIAPTGRHAEPGTHAARFGFTPRLRFSEMLGAVDAAGHVTGTRRDMMAIRGSVMEILATARRVARGGRGLGPFYFAPGRHWGRRACSRESCIGANSKPRSSAAGNELQPVALDLQDVSDIRGSGSGRRNSKTPEEHVRFEAFPGLVGGTAMSPGVQVEYGPMDADDAANDADELAALLQETLRCVERDAPPVANNSLESADISEMVRKKAITAADQLVRGDISRKKWRVRNKIFLRSGA